MAETIVSKELAIRAALNNAAFPVGTVPAENTLLIKDNSATLPTYTRLTFNATNLKLDGVAPNQSINTIQDIATTASPVFVSVSVTDKIGIRETGATPIKYTYFQGGDQFADITYVLPAALTDGYLKNVSGTMSWVATPPPAPHNILSTEHGDSTAASVVRGDIITGQGATPKWVRLAITVPGAGLMNYLGAANGDTEPGYKALFDATVPGTIAESATAATGSATVAARRDHTHGAPATWAPTAHVLNSATHTVSGLTWGHFLKALSATTFGFAAHGLSYGDVGAAAASHAHAWSDITSGVPATWTPAAHGILDSTYHSDVLTGSITRGDILYGNATPKIARLALGTNGYLLGANATDVVYNSLSGWGIQPLHANLTSLAGLSYGAAAFVKMTGANTFTLDTTIYVTGTPWTSMGYLTANQTITLSGVVTGSGTTAITTSFDALGTAGVVPIFGATGLAASIASQYSTNEIDIIPSDATKVPVLQLTGHANNTASHGRIITAASASGVVGTWSSTAANTILGSWLAYGTNDAGPDVPALAGKFEWVQDNTTPVGGAYVSARAEWYLGTTSASPTLRMALTQLGLGIGMTPTMALDVTGSARVSANLGVGGAASMATVDIYANKAASNMLYLANANASYGSLLTFPKGSIGEYGASYGGTICGINYANLFRMSATSNVAMLIDINGDYPIVFGTNSVEAGRFTDAGLDTPGLTVDHIGQHTGGHSVVVDNMLGCNIAVPEEQLHVGGNVLISGGYYLKLRDGDTYICSTSAGHTKYYATTDHKFYGSCTDVLMTISNDGASPAGLVSVGGAVAITGVQTDTITGASDTTTPSCSRLELTCAAPASTTLQAGDLPAGSILYVYQPSTSSYCTVNGYSLTGTVGVTFIKTTEGNWVCVGQG